MGGGLLPLNVTGFCAAQRVLLLLFESVQSRFLARKNGCLHFLLLSFHFRLHFVLYSLLDDILGGQIINMARIVIFCQIRFKRV